MKILISLFLLFTTSAWAAKTLRCDYNNKLSQVEFSLSSFDKATFQKDFVVKEKTFKIFVKDINLPSEVDDFVTISNDKYKMTYALNCKLHDPQLANNSNYLPREVNE